MSFEAKYPGPCAYGDDIEPGDLCTFDEDENIAHVSCPAKDATDQPDWSSVCQKCFLDHAGECF
ncbi:hypothetical protein [Mycolicibacterium fortuitum]